jgi:hypothetical protein
MFRRRFLLRTCVFSISLRGRRHIGLDAADKKKIAPPPSKCSTSPWCRRSGCRPTQLSDQLERQTTRQIQELLVGMLATPKGGGDYAPITKRTQFFVYREQSAYRTAAKGTAKRTGKLPRTFKDLSRLERAGKKRHHPPCRDRTAFSDLRWRE